MLAAVHFEVQLWQIFVLQLVLSEQENGTVSLISAAEVTTVTIYAQSFQAHNEHGSSRLFDN